MTPDGWKEVQRLFIAALERGPDERASFIEEVCEDTEIKSNVQAMLAADENAPSILESAPELTRTLGVTISPDAPDETEYSDRLIGRKIGPYFLERRIAKGGMGTVYLARREDLDTKVALKIVRGGLASAQAVERFLHERRVLAKLEHPNIARLLDAGMADEDTPYFVMEFVEGKSLNVYCDEERLSVLARLNLFMTVCDAVHYAHQNLVIHRDLKPSNILVASPKAYGETEGVVKLLDFGISKLVEEDDHEGMTRTGMRLMTPDYAAPEQVAGKTITTATDVYALGLLLYELLSGSRPYVLKGKSLAEMEALVCEKEPDRPSVAVKKAGSTQVFSDPETRATLRSTTADGLRRKLVGDLDTICLKALSKEPYHRYASVEAMKLDIARYLSGQPLEARPRTYGYRTRKFVRRHKIGALAAAFVVVSLVAGLSVAIWQANVARAERDRASLELAKSEEVTAFLMDMVKTFDPSKAPREGFTPELMLRRGLAWANELRDHPGTRARILNVLGQAYHGLGRLDRAQPLFEEALALRREGSEPPEDVAESLTNLAILLHDRGHYYDALPLFREALEIQRELFGRRHLEVAVTLNALGRLVRDMGDLDESEANLREALSIRRSQLGNQHPDVAETLNTLGVTLRLKRQYDEAEASYAEALRINRAVYGREHPEIARTLNSLGVLYQHREMYERAEENLTAALEMRRRLLGDEHPDVALTLGNLGVIYAKTGRLDAAETTLRNVIEMRQRLLGPEHPHIAITMHHLALVVWQKGRTDEAAMVFRETIAMRRKLLGERHASVGSSLAELGRLQLETGVYTAAESALHEALSIIVETYGRQDDRAAAIRADLVRLYEAWGRPAEADSWREPPTDHDPT